MNDLVKKDEQALLSFLESKEKGVDLPNPFERDIYLFETIIAGTSHINNIEEIAQELNIDDKLIFYREANNKYDPQAIRIENINKDKIGYIPRQDNIVFSRLMDAGKALFGRVKSKEKRGRWFRIIIKIYMHEN